MRLADAFADPKEVSRVLAGLGAPALRACFRRVPGPKKKAFWSLIGYPLSRGSWRFSIPTEFGFRMRGDTRDLISRYVYFFGVWEPSITRWIVESLRPGDTFVDVGANIGYYSLLASRIVGPAGSVVAIEASSRIAAQLEENLRLNGASNVRIAQVAAAEHEGTLELFAGPAWNRGMTSTMPDARCTLEERVSARPLSAILRDDEIAAARIVKIDVEGGEWGVVAGLTQALPRLRQDVEFVMEIQPRQLESQGRSAGDLMSIFAGAGFHPYYVENEYTWYAYVAPQRAPRPRRIDGPLDRQFDVIFSRRNVDELMSR